MSPVRCPIMPLTVHPHAVGQPAQIATIVLVGDDSAANQTADQQRRAARQQDARHHNNDGRDQSRTPTSRKQIMMPMQNQAMTHGSIPSRLNGARSAG